MTLPRRLLCEPLIQFLLIGALLFVYFERKGGKAGPGSTRITVTPGLVEHLASGFTRTWQRPPTDTELKGQIDEHVKEEVAMREAVAMGLDQDDTIIRRRLRQKLEFLIEGTVDQVPPRDTELEAWLDEHPEAFQAEPRVALRQVYVSAEHRGSSARAEAKKLLARLHAAGPGAKFDALGDASLLPSELPLGPVSEVARAFGAEFTARIDAVPAGVWTGPIASSYGLHLVLVLERAAPTTPALADVRPLVERELTTERRRKELQAFYERLLVKYVVAIEMPKDEKKEASAAGSGDGSW